MISSHQAKDYSLTSEIKGDIRYFISRPLLEKHAILAVFTSRLGGVSPIPYSSLNLAFHVGDNKENVIKNRKRVLDLFNLDHKRVVCAEQVHGSDVAFVDESDVGKGALSLEGSVKGVDALVTSSRRVPLALFYADCVPVILVDPSNKATGVTHAGWRGIYGRIIENSVNAMKSLGTNPGNLLAFIGPAIGGCCYQVSEDLADKFAGRFEGIEAWLNGDKIDLRKLGKRQLIASGILAQNIYILSDYCTSCRGETFYSHRAQGGKTGRLAAITALI